MKYKLSPDLAYLAGLCRARPSARGLGVSGSGLAQNAFVKKTLELKLAPPDKILVEGEDAFFFHSALKTFLEKTVLDAAEIFSRRNEKSAAYVSGLFDGCGGFDKEKGGIFFSGISRSDELMLLRLGFNISKQGSKFFVLKPKLFLDFVGKHSALAKELDEQAAASERVRL